MDDLKEEIEVKSERSARSERSELYERSERYESPRLLSLYALIRRFPRPKKLFKFRRRVPDLSRPIVDERSRVGRWTAGTEETLSEHNDNGDGENTEDTAANTNPEPTKVESEHQGLASTTSQVEVSKPASVAQVSSSSSPGRGGDLLSRIGGVAIHSLNARLIVANSEDRQNTHDLANGEAEAPERHRSFIEEGSRKSPTFSDIGLNSSQQSKKGAVAQSESTSSPRTITPTKFTASEADLSTSLIPPTTENVGNITSPQPSNQSNEEYSLPSDAALIPRFPVSDISEANDMTMNQGSSQEKRNELLQGDVENNPLQGQMAMVPTFRLIGANLYEATTLQPDDRYQNQWSDMWKNTLNFRLKQLHLGPHVITNLRLCMVGPQANERSMVPTILLVCPMSKRHEIETAISRFVSLFNPPVELKIIGGRVKFASGSIGFPSNAGEKTELLVSINLKSHSNSLMGSLCRVLSPENGGLYYPASSVGGLISVGDSLYALSVSHSMFSFPKEIELNPGLSSHGKVAYYEWSANNDDDDGEYSKSTQKPPDSSMDWMLIHTKPEFLLPNIFQTSQSDTEYQVHGFWLNNELTDGKVWVCAGVSGIQTGVLNSISSVLTYGQVNYDVLSIALEYPLEDGDSGSWVMRDSKVCGIIFARLDGFPWAYMLPIENTFKRIAQVCTPTGTLDQVRIPTLAKLQELKSGTPRRLSTETTNIARQPAHLPPVEPASIPSPTATLSDKDDNLSTSITQNRESSVTDIRLDTDIPPVADLTEDAEEKQRRRRKEWLLSEQPSPLNSKKQTPDASSQRNSSRKSRIIGSKLRRAFRKIGYGAKKA